MIDLKNNMKIKIISSVYKYYCDFNKINLNYLK